MTDRPFNVLILCTGNSARSILGEALINHWGRGKFVGYSAGSQPKGQVHPIALELLRHMKMPTEGMRSKSWDEFARPERRSWTSCSPSATTPRVRPARCGPASP
jgi:arsenate reductase